MVQAGYSVGAEESDSELTEDRQTRHVIRQDTEISRERARALAIAVIILVAIGALYLERSARIATAGRNLQELEARRQQLEQQNAQLRAEIAGLQSVPGLTARAEALGFHPATADEIEYIPLPNLPPAPIVAPTPSLPDVSVQAESYEETLGSWLTVQWQRLREQFGVVIHQEAEP